MTEDEMVGWHHQLNGLSLSKFREIVMDKEAWRTAVHGLQRVRHDLAIKHNVFYHSIYSFGSTCGAYSLRFLKDENKVSLFCFKFTI